MLRVQRIESAQAEIERVGREPQDSRHPGDHVPDGVVWPAPQGVDHPRDRAADEAAEDANRSRHQARECRELPGTSPELGAESGFQPKFESQEGGLASDKEEDLGQGRRDSPDQEARDQATEDREIGEPPELPGEVDRLVGVLGTGDTERDRP